MSDADQSDSDSSSVEQNQIRISLRLAKECQDKSLSVPSAAIAVPADVGRKGLSAVVNHLLERENMLSFDFIVANTGRLLRTGLEREARRSGISLEEAVPLTYFPALPIPEAKGESEEAPDWIDSLCIHGDVLIAGCYDGSLVTYGAGQLSLTKQSITAMHKGAIKCVGVHQKHSTSKDLLVASGSMDQTLKLSVLGSDGTMQALADCLTGHSASISSLAFSKSTGRLASADWDGGLCLWNPDAIQEGDTQTEQASKKSKSNKKGVANDFDNNGGTILPLFSLRVHASNVSGIHWEQNHLLTCSWDHSLKVWDIEKQNCLLTLNGSRVVSGMDASHYSPGIVATGHPDCSIRLWDTRTDAKENSDSINENSFRPSHKEWVSCVKWSKRNAFHLASTSHDGSVKLWDIRSSIPLHTVQAFPKEEKGLCLEFGPSTNETTRIFVGGTDRIVKEYSI